MDQESGSRKPAPETAAGPGLPIPAAQRPRGDTRAGLSRGTGVSLGSEGRLQAHSLQTRAEPAQTGRSDAGAHSHLHAESSLAASVIVSTYNHPQLLERTLLGYARQDRLDFELVLADDGSGPATAELIARMAPLLPYPLVHTWQPDQGFRKARAVNLAVLRSRASYLIFSDGDCIPSRSFVSEHLRTARPGRFVVGGYVRLSRAQTQALQPDDVSSGRFEALATARQRLALHWTHWKSLLYIALRKRRKPKFYGLNFSVDRASFARVNGFDMTFENCSREDSDLRNRMRLAGMGALSLWDRVGVYHQHHRSHSTRTGWLQVPSYYNRSQLSPEAPQGLRELLRQLSSGGPVPLGAPLDPALPRRRSER